MSYPWENLIHPGAVTALRELITIKGAEMLQLDRDIQAIHAKEPPAADRWTRSGELQVRVAELDEIIKSLRVIADMTEALVASEQREVARWH